ncbi:MAG TPA: HAD-IB family phosphatase [Acidimicrobiia bacterium]|nr:HAD-IB family phosphatase [Acidimicrobiia bacterium]
MPTRVALDLRTTSVFLDFDGTVTLRDVGQHLLARHAADAWLGLHDEYDAGVIGSRECLVGQWELLDVDEATLRATAAEVPIDPGFVPLVATLRDASAELTVVSDGFGFYADAVCGPAGVPVLTNRVDWVTGVLQFPHEDRCCACATCGVCKQAPIKDAHRAGRTTVLIGDGTSDRKAALLADVVFAKGALADWCDWYDVPHHRFATLADVHAALVP